MTLTTIVVVEIAIAFAIMCHNFRTGLKQAVAEIIDELSLRAFVVGVLIVFLENLVKALQ